jgi:hypothetical protein
MRRLKNLYHWCEKEGGRKSGGTMRREDDVTKYLGFDDDVRVNKWKRNR